MAPRRSASRPRPTTTAARLGATGSSSGSPPRTIGPGDPAPRTRYGQTRGTPLPRDQALVEATIRLPAGEHRPSWRWDRVTLTCPQGFVQAGGLSAGGGPRAGRVLASGAAIFTGSQARAGRTRRGTVIFKPRPRLKRAATIRVGIVCMTPTSFWRQKRARMRGECRIFRREERRKRAAGERVDPRLVRARRINCRWRDVGP